MKSITKETIIAGILVYIASSLFSYVIFSKVLVGGKLTRTSGPTLTKVNKEEGKIVFDESLPKTESCPLSGVLYSKQQKDWWEKHRPLGVMIENHQEARPQSGVSSSDIVYEAVAEGGITRFLAIFHCQDAGIVGPVRSARTYFLDYISEYGTYPFYAHVGGANTSGPADALSQIEDYGWQAYNDLNQFSIGFPTFWRDYERMGHPVATEHTMYSTTQKLWKEGEGRGLTSVDKKNVRWDESFVPYKFKSDLAAPSPTAAAISFTFWEGYDDYNVTWNYDKASNGYLRLNGGKKHTDKDNGQQLSAKNVVILFERESRANDGYEGNLHMLYGDKGTGKALIFQDGKEIIGTWAKRDRTSRTTLRDSAGQEIEFNRGRIWFEIVSIVAPVTVK